MKSLNRIKTALKDNDKTQLWLSETIGVSRNSISKWCNNEIQPTLSDLDKIADALNIDIMNLITPKQPDINKFVEYRLKFQKPYFVPSTLDGITIYYPYTINDKLLYGMQMSISGTLAIGWGFQIWQPNQGKKLDLLNKVLFQFVKKYLTQKILDRNLKETENSMLLTSNAPARIPYREEELEDVEGQIHLVKMSNSQINLLEYLNKHCKFFMLTGGTITGIMLPDSSEQYFIVKTENLRAYKDASDSNDSDKMNELKLYIEKSDVLNAEDFLI